MNQQEVQTPKTTQYTLLEFNHTRHSRGKEAAKIKIIEPNGDDYWLWMSVSDIKKNIKQFGEQDAFTQALAAYGVKQ
ncbi:MAG: hypothetical protein Q7S87_04925 [Agitococcus sp.]|nr:hypothetical protein [Agitococcus sp.]